MEHMFTWSWLMAHSRFSVNARQMCSLMLATLKANFFPLYPASPPSPLFWKLALHTLAPPGHGGGARNPD